MSKPRELEKSLKDASTRLRTAKNLGMAERIDISILINLAVEAMKQEGNA